MVDFTVSTRAIVNALYVNLPANGSELVLFDLNRTPSSARCCAPSTDTVLARLLPAPPRTLPHHDHHQCQRDRAPRCVERVTEAGATTEQTRTLGLAYPSDVFSLSHLALPFPLNDSLYGMQPDPNDEDFGVHLGTMAARGERGALIVSLDSLFRMSSNPFFPVHDGADRGRHRQGGQSPVGLPRRVGPSRSRPQPRHRQPGRTGTKIFSPSRCTSRATLFGLACSTLAHLLDRLHRLAVDRQQHVTGLDAGARGRAADVLDHQALVDPRLAALVAASAGAAPGRAGRPARAPASPSRPVARSRRRRPGAPRARAPRVSRQTFSLTRLAGRRQADQARQRARAHRSARR